VNNSHDHDERSPLETSDSTRHRPPAGQRGVSPDELGTRTTPPEDGPRRMRPSQEACIRCLVTNDDGIDSEGLRTLALVAVEGGLEVVVAGPMRNCSGASSSITAVEADGCFVVERRPLAGLDACDTYAVGGLPAFIALTGSRGAFGPPPDILLSGINHGPNTGHAILHSGTVGAALTASTHGLRAMAVSIGPGNPPHWETAADVARRVLPWLVEAPAGTVLNVNVPDVPLGEVRGLRQANLASFGAVQTNIVEKGEGYVQVSVSEIEAEHEPGTDAALLAAGYATVTALRSVCKADEVEVPTFPDGWESSATALTSAQGG
jgi:5'-nucleotidase